jgi:GNAT superfamily N-acetyltransferase
VRGRVWQDDEDDATVRYLTASLDEGPGRMSIYVAYVEDRPACSAWILFPGRGSFASLWGGSTVPEFRRRGLYTALLSVRALEARRRGFRYLTVDASPMSRPILEKFGFRLLAWTWPCEWKPAAPPETEPER